MSVCRRKMQNRSHNSCRKRGQRLKLQIFIIYLFMSELALAYIV